MTVVLDSWALLAYLRDEPAAAHVEAVLAEGRSIMSSVNMGEVLYWTIRERGDAPANATIGELRSAVRVENPDWRLVEAASRIKARGGLSYADAFCVATAQRHRAPLYTGDLEIIRLDDAGVEIVDLRNQP
jgi:PIN domain nuclease of toxin-antitoxin system